MLVRIISVFDGTTPTVPLVETPPINGKIYVTMKAETYKNACLRVSFLFSSSLFPIMVYFSICLACKTTVQHTIIIAKIHMTAQKINTDCITHIGVSPRAEQPPFIIGDMVSNAAKAIAKKRGISIENACKKGSK